MDINSLIALANENLMCGPDCKKDKQSQRLREIYDKAKQNLIDAPSEFSKAERNFLVDARGEYEYINIMKERKIKTMNNMKKKLLEKHTQFMNDIRGFLNQYNTDYIYYHRMDDFYKSNLKDNKKYKNDIADFTSAMNVNNRKVFYEDEEIEQMSFTRIILLTIYFVVLIAILYKVEFIGKEYYRNRYVMFAIFTYVMFGIYVDWVSKMVYYTKNRISQLLENEVPRNVYVSM
jgi:hypothetical protein